TSAYTQKRGLVLKNTTPFSRIDFRQLSIPPKGRFLNHFGYTSWDVVILFGIAMASIVTQFFRAKAYAYGTPSRFSSFLYLAVLLAGVWDWLVFHNPPNAFALIGAALIILGGVLKMYLRNWILKRGQK
ncbi:MAG TPA: DMT family transporter, partial [Chlamydiales bacterium]|nr:DMT family transporter [Chlamydiales bacterium]